MLQFYHASTMNIFKILAVVLLHTISIVASLFTYYFIVHILADAHPIIFFFGGFIVVLISIKLIHNFTGDQDWF